MKLQSREEKFKEEKIQRNHRAENAKLFIDIFFSSI